MPSQLHLRILDQHVDLRTDNAQLASWLEGVYDRFRASPLPPTLEIIAETQPDRAITAQSNAAVRLSLYDLPVAQQAAIVIKTIYAHVESHLLFHAGVVARPSNAAEHSTEHSDTGEDDDIGVVLVGHSGSGKTTLALELVRRGWYFLSDEVAALAQTTGILAPFPRAVHLRSSSFPLLGLAPNAAGGAKWIDIAGLFPYRMGQPAPARFFFLLHSAQPEHLTLTVTLDGVNTRLPEALQQIPGLTAQPDPADARFINLTGQGVESADIYYQIERICRAHRCRILDIALERHTLSAFTSAPVLTPLPPAAAAMALLPHLQSGRRSRIWYGPWQGNPLALFRALAQRLSTLHCFRLQPGPLAATADLIEKTVGELA